MDFNPLDLLASAAELQKKNEDPEDVAMVTRNRNNSFGNAKSFTAVVHKDGNKELRTVNNNKNINNNNNINIKGKSVIIRKIKVGANTDLEKMLNEHNYGNAKKSFESSIKVVFEDGGGNRSEDLSESSSEESPIAATSVHTVGNNNGDNSAVISLMNKESGSHTNTTSEVGCNSGQLNTNVVDTVDSTSTCISSINTDTSGGKDSPLACVESSKCVESDCGSPRALQAGEHVSRENDLGVDKPTGQLEVSSDGQALIGDSGDQLYDSENRDRTFTCSDSTCTGKDSTCKSDVDETTEVQSQCDGVNKIELIENRNLMGGGSSDDGENVLTSIDCVSKVASETDASNVFVRDRLSTELDFKASTTSDSRKAPYVNVSAVKSVKKCETDAAQSLVISIKNGKNDKALSEKEPTLENVKNNSTVDDYDLEQGEKKTNSRLDIIRSLLTSDKQCEKSNCTDKSEPVVMDMVSSKPMKLDISQCDQFDIGKQTEDYGSLKSFQLNDSMCGDSTSGSVHLMSPDRRNPDSVGIAESPVTNLQQDSVPSEGGTELQQEKQEFFNDTFTNLEKLQGSSLLETSEDKLEGKTCRDLEQGDVDKFANSIRSLKGSKLLLAGPSGSDNTRANSPPVFRFEFDHSYAGMPGKINSSDMLRDQESLSQSEETDVGTPLGSSGGDLSQDSGYEDITPSPVSESVPLSSSCGGSTGSNVNVNDSILPSQNLVPVLVSINDNGSLMLHSDKLLQKTISGQMFAVQGNNGTSHSADSGVKLISGTNLTPLSTAPLLLSPVGKGLPMTTAVQPNTEGVIGLLRSTTPDVSLNPLQASQQISPPKFGKFKIGTFASFSNTGMKIEEPQRLYFNRNSVPDKASKANNASHSKKNSSTHSKTSGKASPVGDTLSTLVEKVRSNLSPSSQIDTKTLNIDHIHHDHDYCMKNLMPSVVSSVLEAKLQKEFTKNKQSFPKSKKTDSDQYSVKSEAKYSNKRKRSLSSSGDKEELSFENAMYDDMDSNSQPEFIRPKSRAERYIEQKSSEPKVKITGSSNFQDQFVYFMNTKKRSRRRESRDSPSPVSLDKLFIPPKPGDIIVPHLTDQDIEFLKQRSKQKSGQSSFNSLRNEFMASKLGNTANTPYSTQTSVQPENVDDEKNIINTILSLENENLADDPADQTDDPETPYNESMEMYGQGLGGDIMSLTPEQMNLTQEQMDLLFSAVDEVQNSSPGLIGEEKLVSTESDSTFGQFPPAVIDGAAAVPPILTNKQETEVKGDDSSCEVLGVVEKTESLDDKTREGESLAPTEVTDKTVTDKSVDVGTKPESAQAEVTSGPDTNTSNSETVKQDLTEAPSPSKESGEPKVSLLEAHLTRNDNPTINTSDVPTSRAPSSLSYDRQMFGIPDLVQSSSVSTMILPSSLPTTSGNLNNEIPLQTLERGPLDLLSNDFRLDKNYLFSDSATPTSSSTLAPSNMSSPVQVPPDYSAPWIVTVSMYWNDLPAIMMQNQPYVRLVDIHKQILPAKDTGILKKRCQLMGIRVENCSEMQRYFLVQYGRAFNSKSTLIVSKECANVLIGYYVDPQPKTNRTEEHSGKSVIEHRREQLRRIALARRAEIRARQNAERKGGDPRAIKETETTQELGTLPPQDQSSVEVEVPKVLSGVVRPSVQVPASAPSHTSQRSTRHKKINFLEMLRGDASSSIEGEGAAEESSQVKKQSQKHDNGELTVKKPKRSLDKKIKIVKYSVQTPVPEYNSETETDYSSNEGETDSTSGSEIYIVKKSYKPRKIVHPDSGYKSKSKLKVSNIKKPVRLPLKVKINTKRQIKTASTLTPVSMNRSVGTLAAPFSQQKRDRLVAQQIEKHSSYSEHRVHTSSVVNSLGTIATTPATHSDENKTLDSILKFDKNVNDYEKVKVMPSFSEDLHITNFGDFGSRSLLKEFTEADLKVSQSLPSEILDTSGIQESETCADSEETLNKPVMEVRANTVEGQTDHDLVTESTSDQCVNTNHAVVKDNVESVLENISRSHSPVNGLNMRRIEPASVTSREIGLQIIHRESSPSSEGRGRSQLGELFMEKYSNKKSLCIRCYTCRKMMSVDTFLRHLHDVSGGFIPVNGSRTIDIGESDPDNQALKVWESFQRKKELFDNNQVPSPDIFAGRMLCSVDADSNGSNPENTNDISVKSSGPLIITTPVCSSKTFLSSRQTPATVLSRRGSLSGSTDGNEGTRSSSRKRKKKQLYPCEEYSFSKFPRLQGGCEKSETTE